MDSLGAPRVPRAYAGSSVTKLPAIRTIPVISKVLRVFPARSSTLIFATCRTSRMPATGAWSSGTHCSSGSCAKSWRPTAGAERPTLPASLRQDCCYRRGWRTITPPPSRSAWTGRYRRRSPARRLIFPAVRGFGERPGHPALPQKECLHNQWEQQRRQRRSAGP